MTSSFPASPLVASGPVNLDLDPTFIAHFVLFTAFIWVIKDVVFKPLLEVFEERRRRTAGAIEEARGMDDEAIDLKQEFDGKLEGVRREAAGDRERIRAKTKHLEAKLQREAREAADATLSIGMEKVDGEVATIRGELEKERADLASEIATRVLGREVRSRAGAR